MAMLFESMHLACRALTYIASIGPPHLSINHNVIHKADIFNANSNEHGTGSMQAIATVTKASPLRHVVDAVIETSTLCELAVMITTPHIPIRGEDDTLYIYQLEAYRLLQRLVIGAVLELFMNAFTLQQNRRQSAFFFSYEECIC
jgi:hypothetical protein